MNVSDVLGVIGGIGGLLTVLSGVYQAMANKDKIQNEADEAQGKATKLIIDSAAESLRIVQVGMGEMRLELTELKATVKTLQTVREQMAITINSLEAKIFELNRTIIQLQSQADRDSRKIAELMAQVEALQNENITLKTELQKTGSLP